MVATRWADLGEAGLVVGATFPAQLAAARAIVGDLPVLVPGIGTQGGDLEASVRAGSSAPGAGLLLSASRSILYASRGEDFAEAARAAAIATRTRDQRRAADRTGSRRTASRSVRPRPSGRLTRRRQRHERRAVEVDERPREHDVELVGAGACDPVGAGRGARRDRRRPAATRRPMPSRPPSTGRRHDPRVRSRPTGAGPARSRCADVVRVSVVGRRRARRPCRGPAPRAC